MPEKSEQICWQIVSPTPIGEILIVYGSDPVKKLAFKEAANYLAMKLKRKYNCKSPPKPVNIDCGGDLMKLLLKKREGENRIKELHIFSHAWLTGLSMNFGGTATSSHLQSLKDVYGNLVSQFIGSDDYNQFWETQLRISNFHYLTKAQQEMLMDNFAPAAKIQLWGCNAGSQSEAISQTLANCTRTATWGSTSGTHFEVYAESKWMKYDDEARKKYGKLVRQGKIPFMMAPDNGKYKEFKPNKKIDQLTFKKLELSVMLMDEKFDEIYHSRDSMGNKLYSIKCNDIFLVNLEKFNESFNKTVAFFDDSGQVDVNLLMAVQEHSEWNLKGGEIELFSRNLFSATAKPFSDYFKDKRFWIEVKWQTGSFSSQGKQEIKFIK